MTKKTIMFPKPMKVLVHHTNNNISHYTIVGIEYLTIRSRPELIVKTLDCNTFSVTADLLYDDTIDNERRLNQIAQLSDEMSSIRIRIHELSQESKPVKPEDMLHSLIKK